MFVAAVHHMSTGAVVGLLIGGLALVGLSWPLFIASEGPIDQLVWVGWIFLLAGIVMIVVGAEHL